MAEVHSEAIIRVDVENQKALESLNSALSNLNKSIDDINKRLKPTAVTAAGAAGAASATDSVKRKGKAAEQQIEQQMSVGQRMLVRAVSTTIAAPIKAVIATAQVTGGMLQSFAGSILPALARLSPLVLAAGGLGLAFFGLLVPLAKIVGGIKLLGTSFEWAQEQAASAMKVAAETRRRYPGLAGQAFDKAQDEVQTRMNTMSAIFGQSADGIAEQVEQKMMNFRLGTMQGPERQMFEYWGLTLQQKMGFEKRSGSRVDLMTYLERFVSMRETLEKRLEQAPKGSRQAQLISNQLGYLADTTMSIFGKQFSDAALQWRSADVSELKSRMADATALGAVDQADRKAIDFQISLKSLLGTFDAIRQGIGGDVMPSITGFMNELRIRLIDVDRGGKGLGKSLRDLGGEMAGAAWKTLDALLRKIDVEKVKGWIKEIQSWNTDKAADNIIELGASIMRFINLLVRGMRWLSRFSFGEGEGLGGSGVGIPGSAGGLGHGPVGDYLRGQKAAADWRSNYAAPTPVTGSTPVLAAPSSSLATRATEVYDELRRRGISHNIASAFLGNAELESGIGAHTNPGEGAVGLIHWRLSRRQFLEQLAKDRGEAGFGGGRTGAEFFTQEGGSRFGWGLARPQKAAWDWIMSHPDASIEEINAQMKRYIAYGTATEGTRLGMARRWDQYFKNRSTEPLKAINSPPLVPNLKGNPAPNLSRDMLSPEKMSQQGRLITNMPADQGAVFGAAMGRSFVQEVQSVPLDINTQSKAPPFQSPAPVGADPPT